VETLPSIRDQIAAEADEWLLRLQAADHSQAHCEAFTDWLMQSPAHIEAYLAVSRAWHALGVPNQDQWSAEALIAAAQAESQSGNVIQLRGMDHPCVVTERLARRLPATSSRRWPARVAAASLVAAVVATAWLFQGNWLPANDLKTSVGEQRSVTLADGSIVFLNTNSELKLHWTKGERRIELLRGEARFQVAKNPARPFVVATQEATVRAVGTVFNIRTGEAITQVAVLEGRVEVNAIPRDQEENDNLTRDTERPAGQMTPDLLLAAGQRAAVTRRGVEANVGPPIERVAAWTERRLVFRGEALSAVVAEFNRYRLQALVVDDPSLAQIRINGVFDLDDPASLVAYLRNFESVQVEQRGDGSKHLTRETR
jgi:transmembrane sensor